MTKRGRFVYSPSLGKERGEAQLGVSYAKDPVSTLDPTVWWLTYHKTFPPSDKTHLLASSGTSSTISEIIIYIYESNEDL